MPDSVHRNGERPLATVIPISAEERQRERALRERFASFWATAVGEPRAVYDRFIADSPLVEGVSLAEVDEPAVKGWWVRPDDAAPAQQAILYLHGGGYVQGSAKAYRGFASQLVGRTGVPAFVIDYPLAPEARLPSAPNAALKAWQYLRDRGFDRIAIVGDSAGGNLTLVTAQQVVARFGGEGLVAGVAFSPWTDMALTGASYRDESIDDPLISFDFVAQCAVNVLGDMAPTDPIASPLYGAFAGLPPLLIQVGADETIRDDSVRFAARADDAGVPVQLEIWDGMHHVFQLDVAHLESSRNALDRAAGFLRGVFGA